MFTWTYYLKTVNAEKNIVSLRPTAATWAKAFAPSLIVAVGFAGMVAVGTIIERRESKKDVEHRRTHVDPFN